MIGHRSNDFKKLYAGHPSALAKPLRDDSARLPFNLVPRGGVMEGAIRNLVNDGKVLNCMCGAFSFRQMVGRLEQMRQRG